MLNIGEFFVNIIQNFECILYVLYKKIQQIKKHIA